MLDLMKSRYRFSSLRRSTGLAFPCASRNFVKRERYLLLILLCALHSRYSVLSFAASEKSLKIAVSHAVRYLHGSAKNVDLTWGSYFAIKIAISVNVGSLRARAVSNSFSACSVTLERVSFCPPDSSLWVTTHIHVLPDSAAVGLEWLDWMCGSLLALALHDQMATALANDQCKLPGYITAAAFRFKLVEGAQLIVSPHHVSGQIKSCKDY
jgi:hypothetical protein